MSLSELDPAKFYRKAEAIKRRFFGLGHSQLEEAIKDGLVPPPVDAGPRTTGWYGRTIIKHQNAKAAAAKHEHADT